MEEINKANRNTRVFVCVCTYIYREINKTNKDTRVYIYIYIYIYKRKKQLRTILFTDLNNYENLEKKMKDGETKTNKVNVSILEVFSK